MKHFDEEVDGIIYAAFVGLGFALNENIYYLTMLEGGQAVARSLISPIIHALFASVWGYTYGDTAVAGSYPWTRPDLFVDRSPLYSADRISDEALQRLYEWLRAAP